VGQASSSSGNPAASNGIAPKTYASFEIDASVGNLVLSTDAFNIAMASRRHKFRLLQPANHV
jgi:hypothetical protein